MSAATDFAMMYARDLKRLGEELAAFAYEDHLWATLPGVANSAGHLTLHLEGNLREFIGRQLGEVAYLRDRPQEFAGQRVQKADLLARVRALETLIPRLLISLSDARMEEEYPQDFMGRSLSTRAMLIHLNGHLHWHLGQIDYLRRVLSGTGAVTFSGL